MLFILRMDNPKIPEDTGQPTRVRLIGPFSTEVDRQIYIDDPQSHLCDTPFWQCVDLDPAACVAGSGPSRATIIRYAVQVVAP